MHVIPIFLVQMQQLNQVIDLKKYCNGSNDLHHISQ